MFGWNDFDRFDDAFDGFLPAIGDGETQATQAVTAASKLVYKWFNDGDVFDNTHELKGWVNDLSSYANWLAAHIEDADWILEGICDCSSEDDYAELLYELCETVEGELSKLAELPKDGTIYACNGQFKFIELNDEEEW